MIVWRVMEMLDEEEGDEGVAKREWRWMRERPAGRGLVWGGRVLVC